MAGIENDGTVCLQVVDYGGTQNPNFNFSRVTHATARTKHVQPHPLQSLHTVNYTCPHPLRPMNSDPTPINF
jgi:hypothetical protein